MRDAGQFVDGEPPVKVLQRVPHGAPDRVAGRRPAHRVLHELGLAALSVPSRELADGFHHSMANGRIQPCRTVAGDLRHRPDPAVGTGRRDIPGVPMGIMRRQAPP
nr:hypothetical protein KitaXyl93_68040 [Kitasatospora sp. Xyl93]